MHNLRPVEVRAQAGISAGAMLWRYQGALHVTAIVKATFSIAPDGTVSLAPPEPLLPADVHRDDDPRRSLLHATDRVPFRPHADVVLTGAAHAPGGRGQRAVARLGVRRDRVLIDKTIHVVGDPAASYWFSSKSRSSRRSRLPSQVPSAPGQAPFPIAPAGATGSATTEGTPWAAAPLAPAPQSSRDFDGTLDLTSQPASAPASQVPGELSEPRLPDDGPPDSTPNREHEPPAGPEPVASPLVAPTPREAREERVVSVREHAPPAPPPPRPPPRPPPPPKPDRNEGLYQRFSSRKK